jgi:predicted negative regulator of RcsB-dependent stress response
LCGGRCLLRPVVLALWRNVVKKLLVLVLVAAAGFAVWRKMESDRAEQALWAEVTDPVK